MKRMIVGFGVVAVISFLAGAGVTAQTKSAWPWPMSMDAISAAPEVHKVLVENDHIRLLEVTLQLGQTEKPHDHRWPSAIIMDAPTGPRNNCDAVAKTTVAMEPRFENAEWSTPQTVVLPGQGPHQLTNTGTYPVHFYRLEFKRMDGNEIMKMKKY